MNFPYFSTTHIFFFCCCNFIEYCVYHPIYKFFTLSVIKQKQKKKKLPIFYFNIVVVILLEQIELYPFNIYKHSFIYLSYILDVRLPKRRNIRQFDENLFDDGSLCFNFPTLFFCIFLWSLFTPNKKKIKEGKKREKII